MKKLLLLLLCVPLLFSCGEKNKYNFRQIDLIKEPCDCLDHLIEVFKKGVSKMKSDNNYNAKNDLHLENQSNKIQEYCEAKFGKGVQSTLILCDNADEWKEIFQEMKELSLRRTQEE